MNRRTKKVLLIGGVAVAAAVATVVVLTVALAKVIDPQNYCDTGFSPLINCTYHVSTKTTSRRTPSPVTPANAASPIKSEALETSHITSIDMTSWAVVDCPRNAIIRRLLCRIASDATPAAATDDVATGLPRPKPWLVTTAKNSMFIKALHVETPLDLAGVLRFYRFELSKRGWSESNGAVVEPDAAVINFTTADGPALLRLSHQDDRTIVDLSMRKPAATNAARLPVSGQVKVLLGNSEDDKAVFAINEQTIELAAHTELTEDLAADRKSPESQEINLAPGKYRVSLRVASGAAQNREIELHADETWGLVAGSTGAPLFLHLY